MSPLQKVLIVDDSKTNLALLEHMLKSVECEVFQAATGKEAIRQVEAHDFSLILLDIQMPEMDGYEAATRIKASDRGREVPIIFITAIFQDEDHVRKGYDTGAVDYLFRPFNVDILTRKVEVFLKLNAQNAQLQAEIEERKRVEDALRKAETRYRSIFERAVEGLFQCTLDGSFVEINPAMVRILGYESADQVLGRPNMRAEFMADKDELEKYVRTIEEEGVVSGFEFRLRRADGEIIWGNVSSRRVEDLEGNVFIEGVLEDITERKHAEIELKRLAMVDSLTGINNRNLFFDRLENALALAKRNKRQLSVLFIDLNDFKLVNDTYGHQTGDELLRQVAQRLLMRTRESDTLARLGGDEFGLLLMDVADESSALAVAESLVEVMEAPFLIKGEYIKVGATVGISLYPRDAHDAVSLISRADAAMYGAKKVCDKSFATYAECEEARES